MMFNVFLGAQELLGDHILSIKNDRRVNVETLVSAGNVDHRFAIRWGEYHGKDHNKDCLFNALGRDAPLRID